MLRIQTAFVLCILRGILSELCGVELKTAESTTSRIWIQQALDRSNHERRNHHSPPFRLNEELNQILQYWANQLASKYKERVHATSIEKYKNSTCGENLYSRSSPKKLALVGSMTVRHWYNEILDYDFKQGRSRNGKPIQHFTQTVWKATTEFGIAYASDEKGLTFVVAKYFPLGNYLGEFTDNVRIGSKDMVSDPMKPVQPDDPTAPNTPN